VDPSSIQSVPVEYPAAALFVAVDFLPLARFVSMFESDGVCVCALMLLQCKIDLNGWTKHMLAFVNLIWHVFRFCSIFGTK
jgi:hypothetical protein